MHLTPGPGPPSNTETATVRCIAAADGRGKKTATEVELPVRDGIIVPAPESGINALAVVERHKASGDIGRGFASTLGLQRGAIACSVIFATDQFLGERPDVAKRLVAGMKCAYEAARADPDAAADAPLAEFPSKKRAADLASIRGGIILTFESETYQKHGFDWDMDRVARTFELALTAQGETVEGAAGAAYVHGFK